jgi:hypothetical protein
MEIKDLMEELVVETSEVVFSEELLDENVELLLSCCGCGDEDALIP